VLRVLIGEDEGAEQRVQKLWMIETNVDDMPGETLGFVLERALELGALDCYFTPVQMKKSRPAVLLSILCSKAELESLTQMLFAETTTLGVRSYEVTRRALDRRIIRVETRYGPIDVKVAEMNGVVTNAKPEYEQCRQAALRANVPLRVVQETVRLALLNLRSETKED
jgi:uncharacterized protein (DUF111 family)